MTAKERAETQQRRAKQVASERKATKKSVGAYKIRNKYFALLYGLYPDIDPEALARRAKKETSADKKVEAMVAAIVNSQQKKRAKKTLPKRELGIMEGLMTIGPDFEKQGELTEEDYKRLGWL